MIIFPDISFYQDANSTPAGVDFVKMRTQTPAVIIRAGQRSWVDEDMIRNWRESKKAGLVRGAYWFYDSRAEPKSQADLFYATLKDDMPELGVWMDLEESYNGAWGRESDLRKFAERILSNFPNDVEVGVYTSSGWWSNVNRIPIASRDWWLQFPLWIANYGVTKPAIPPPWKDYLFWQFTAKGDGLRYGVESKNIDLNQFAGDEKKLAELFGLSEIPTVPILEPEPNPRRVVIEGDFKITEE